MAFFTACSVVSAQSENTQTISVSPTLFQMSASPAQNWTSELRVTNVNDYDITVYPQVVNFAPLGESGRGDLLPVFSSETQGKTLAEWIDLESTGVLIPRQQTKSLSFSVKVPADAAPGGHYAAILIGTKPPAAERGGSEMQTAQFVTSLFFVRVAGDVVEEGSIREFTTAKLLTPTPDIDLLLRFENSGNVHLQPQGDITITNMWGEERGIIPINQQTHFGNVLPNSIRKFTFTWNGQYSIFDIGRYSAVVTLGYGDEAKHFVTSTTYFWIVPWKQITLFSLAAVAIIWFFTWAVRLYVRRMLVLAGIEPRQSGQPTYRKGLYDSEEVAAVRFDKTVILKRYTTLTAPLALGVRECVTAFTNARGLREKCMVLVQYITHYKFFVLVLVLLVVVSVSMVVYVKEVTTDARPYEVTFANPDSSVTLSSEQIIYNDLKTSLPATTTPAQATTTQPFSIEIVNVSGVSGLAAKTRVTLESQNFAVTGVSTEPERLETKTTIIYNDVDSESIVALSRLLGGVLASASTMVPQHSITLYVGSDQQ